MCVSELEFGGFCARANKFEGRQRSKDPCLIQIHEPAQLVLPISEQLETKDFIQRMILLLQRIFGLASISLASILSTCTSLPLI